MKFHFYTIWVQCTSINVGKRCAWGFSGCQWKQPGSPKGIPKTYRLRGTSCPLHWTYCIASLETDRYAQPHVVSLVSLSFDHDTQWNKPLWGGICILLCIYMLKSTEFTMGSLFKLQRGFPCTDLCSYSPLFLCFPYKKKSSMKVTFPLLRNGTGPLLWCKQYISTSFHVCS